MIEIRELPDLNFTDLVRVADGYVSDSKFAVAYTNSPDYTAFELQRIALRETHFKKYDFDEEMLRRYNSILADGFSFAAYDAGLLVGILISEVQPWNATLWVHEFHVTEPYRKTGIGTKLMEHAAKKALDENLRIIVCETQNTNVPAIDIYRRLGFGIEGIDISHYTNADHPDGEIAIFMKKRLK
jgi:ribosomal protein S18 acetylase RimI-like enzyme